MLNSDSLGIIPLPSISQTLVDALEKKLRRGDCSTVPELWRRLVFRELDWCGQHLECLSPLHRISACKLVDWHHSYYGYTREDWYRLYQSPNEMYRRQTVAELNYCAAHLAELTCRHRDRAIELLEDFYSTNSEDYNPAWEVLYY